MVSLTSPWQALETGGMSPAMCLTDFLDLRLVEVVLYNIFLPIATFLQIETFAPGRNGRLLSPG